MCSTWRGGQESYTGSIIKQRKKTAHGSYVRVYEVQHGCLQFSACIARLCNQYSTIVTFETDYTQLSSFKIVDKLRLYLRHGDVIFCRFAPLQQKKEQNEENDGIGSSSSNLPHKSPTLRFVVGSSFTILIILYLLKSRWFLFGNCYAYKTSVMKVWNYR